MLRLVYNYIIIILIINIAVSTWAKSPIEEAFAGYKIKFDYEKYFKEREIVRHYFPGIPQEKIGIDLFDVDRDGNQEIFIFVKSNLERFEVLKKEKHSTIYNSVCWVTENGKLIRMPAFETLEILTSMTAGYHDIMTSFSKKDHATWKWDGKCYRLSQDEK